MDNTLQRRWRLTVARAFGLAFFPALIQTALADAHLYVSTAGSDSWSGLLAAPNAARTDGPKATLDGAQRAIQRLKAQSNPVGSLYTVDVAPGIYLMRSALILNDSDPLTETVYRSTTPGGAILDGSLPVSGWKIPPASFAARLSPKAKPYILCTDLRAQGFNPLGRLSQSSYIGDQDDISSSYNELYVNGVRQTIARWPNKGYARVQSGGATNVFTADLSTSRVAANDPNVGLYSFASGGDWDFQSIPVQVDRTTNTLRPNVLYSPAVPGGRFFIQNSLEELDTPGEYYVDSNAGLLFWYPTTGYKNADIRVANNPANLIVFDHAQNTTLQGFTMRDGRFDAIRFYEGNYNAVVGCTITNFGGNAAYMKHSMNTSFQSCTVTEMGEGGVRMQEGGDEVTLTRGNNTVQNCKFKGIGRLVPSYRPAVMLEGVGNSAIHNDISDGPHEGIQLSGILLTVEGNHINNVCLDCSDSGAIYSGGNMTRRGNVIRGNLIENAQNRIGRTGIWAIYLDGRCSGTTVDRNVVTNSETGLIIGGGRDNKVSNNVFMNCTGGGIQINTYAYIPSDFTAELSAVPYSTGIWAQTFPQLSTLLSDDPTYPKYNVFTNNVIVGTGMAVVPMDPSLVLAPTSAPTDKNTIGWNNTIVANSPSGLFVNAPTGDFTPVPGSVLSSIGFQNPDPSVGSDTAH